VSCEHYYPTDLCCECGFYVFGYWGDDGGVEGGTMGGWKVEGEGGGVVEGLEVEGLEGRVGKGVEGEVGGC
jgi:hypothetical protein